MDGGTPYKSQYSGNCAGRLRAGHQAALHVKIPGLKQRKGQRDRGWRENKYYLSTFVYSCENVTMRPTILYK